MVSVKDNRRVADASSWGRLCQALKNRMVLINGLKGVALGIICSSYLLAQDYLERMYNLSGLVLEGNYTSSEAGKILGGTLPSLAERIVQPV